MSKAAGTDQAAVFSGIDVSAATDGVAVAGSTGRPEAVLRQKEFANSASSVA